MTKIINFLKLNIQNIWGYYAIITLIGSTIGALDSPSKPYTGMVKGAIIGMTFPVSIPYFIVTGIYKENRRD